MTSIWASAPLRSGFKDGERCLSVKGHWPDVKEVADLVEQTVTARVPGKYARRL